MIKRNKCGHPPGAGLAAGMLFLSLAAAPLAAPRIAAASVNYAQRPEVRAFIAELVADEGFDARALRRLFAQAHHQPKVVAAMSRPVLSPPKWYEFAPRFLDPARVDAGAASWREHSVAHFLARHGWQAGQPVMTSARIGAVNPDAIAGKLDGGIAERRSLAEWVRDGITGFAFPGDLSSDPVGLLMLEEEAGPTYWLVFNNWYVLMRYNRSRLYAAAVWELAQALKLATDGGS